VERRGFFSGKNWSSYSELTDDVCNYTSFFLVCHYVAEPNTRLHVMAVIFVIKTIISERRHYTPTGCKELPYKAPQNTKC